MADGPLRGVRILDLTHVWAGPLGTRILADLGAEVVKIEAPTGRGPREFPRLSLGGWIGGTPGEDPWNRLAVFVKLQRNKRSVAIDLKTKAGREAFLELVAVADVVIENFSADAMPALGLDYDALSRANPSIIYMAMPGYGKDGPYRDRVAFGPTVEVMSGLTHVLGYGADEPRNTAIALMDPIAALNAAGAIVTALRERQATGQGSFIEMSLHESGVAFCGPWLVEHQLGRRVERIGNRHPAMAPHGVYPCSGDDAWVAIACRNDADWRGVCSVIGAALDPTASLADRRAQSDALDETIAAWTASRTKQDATAELQAAGVPAGPVNITPDMTADPQVRERGFFVPIEPGPTPVPGNPIKMDGIGSDDWTPCPTLGADNAAVLRDWLGYDDERIREMERAGVLADKPPA